LHAAILRPRDAATAGLRSFGTLSARIRDDRLRFRCGPVPSMSAMASDARKTLGRLGEQLASDHFARRGCQVLARNHHTRFGELDLVVRDGPTLIFCEVKTCRAGRGEPWDNLHGAKRSQVRRMASVWLNEVRDRPFFTTVRFDAVGVLVDDAGELVRLDHLEGAF
jgi:putative endonuclease